MGFKYNRLALQLLTQVADAITNITGPIAPGTDLGAIASTTKNGAFTSQLHRFNNWMQLILKQATFYSMKQTYPAAHAHTDHKANG